MVREFIADGKNRVILHGSIFQCGFFSIDKDKYTLHPRIEKLKNDIENSFNVKLEGFELDANFLHLYTLDDKVQLLAQYSMYNFNGGLNLRLGYDSEFFERNGDLKDLGSYFLPSNKE